jgi:CHAT domain-containing protein/Tfp pilus assembly protein PilF
MTALNTRRTLSSLMLGSLLLCAAPQTASSQQNADGAKQAEQMVQTCITGPAQQAPAACELIATAVSQMPDSPVVVRIAINARWRDVLVELGRYAEAEGPAKKAVAAAEETKQRRTIAAQQRQLAWVLKNLGRYSEAEALLRSATELAKKEYGAEDVQTAAAMGDLALVLKDQGKPTEAESLYRKSLAIEQKKLGPDHPHVAFILNNLAGVLQDQGKLTEAESLFRKSLAILEKKLEPDHPDLATTLNNLAGVLKDQGKLTEAESLFRKSLAILEKKLEPDHPSLATILGNLAGVLQYQGKLTEAESLYRKSLAIQEKTLGPDNSSVALTLHRLALVHMTQKQPSKAVPLLQRALGIQIKTLGDKSSIVADTMGNLGVALARLGQQAEAEAYLTKSLLILDASGARPSLLAEIRENLALVRSGQSNQTRPSAIQYSVGQVLVGSIPESVTEGMADVLLAQHEPNERLVYGLPLLQGAPSEAGLLALRTSLMMKAQTQEAGKALLELRRTLHTTEQKQKYQTMIALLTQRELLLASANQVRETIAEAASLLRQAQQIYWELAEQSNSDSPSGAKPVRNIVGEVVKALPSDAVLVEFGLGVKADFGQITAREIAATLELHYVAIVLFPSGSVSVVDLGEQESIHGAVQTFLGELQTAGGDARNLARRAYDVLFSRLESVLKPGTRQLIASTDGALSVVPWAALHDGKGYLADRLSFRYVSSGRDLLNQPSQKPTTQPAVMMATRVPGQIELPDAEKVGKTLARTQGATLTEQSTDGQVLLQQSPSMLTLISHGYFGGGSKEEGRSARLPTPPKHAIRSTYLTRMNNEREAPAQMELVMAEKEKTEELMNSSGLMMMPGTNAGTDTKQDGRLTAVEVREMNLQGTKLVMLLACKGAAGGLSFGQGVYGLRRAVLQAGAETVVGTLWSVEEKSASELAKNYMTKLWTDKKATRVGAMDEAMKEMRKDPRYSHPHYWAPFVVMGMDGPLAH